MNISEEEKNEIRGLHKNHSIISEQDDYGKSIKELLGKDLEQLMVDIENHDMAGDRIVDRLGVVLNKLNDDHYFKNM